MQRSHAILSSRGTITGVIGAMGLSLASRVSEGTSFIIAIGVGAGRARLVGGDVGVEGLAEQVLDDVLVLVRHLQRQTC
jgi:hypothetical protein